MCVRSRGGASAQHSKSSEESERFFYLFESSLLSEEPRSLPSSTAVSAVMEQGFRELDAVNDWQAPYLKQCKELSRDHQGAGSKHSPSHPTKKLETDGNTESSVQKQLQQAGKANTVQKLQEIKQSESESGRKRWLFWKRILTKIGLGTLALAGAYSFWRVCLRHHSLRVK